MIAEANFPWHKAYLAALSESDATAQTQLANILRLTRTRPTLLRYPAEVKEEMDRIVGGFSSGSSLHLSALSETGGFPKFTQPHPSFFRQAIERTPVLIGLGKNHLCCQ